MALTEAFRNQIPSMKAKIQIQRHDCLHDGQMTIRLSSGVIMDSKSEYAVGRNGGPKSIIW